MIDFDSSSTLECNFSGTNIAKARIKEYNIFVIINVMNSDLICCESCMDVSLECA